MNELSARNVATTSLQTHPLLFITRLMLTFLSPFGKGSIWTDDVKRICNADVSCDAKQKYRSFDGTCTNLKKPAVGSRGQCYKRLLPASYVDGVSEPPRRAQIAEIFNALQSRPEPPPPPLNTMYATLTQFFVHDVMQTAITTIDGDFDCCTPENCELSKCAMRINTEDALHYKNHSIKCMSFVRAARCPCSDSRTRESMNFQTAYIDLSHVYLDGSNRKQGTPYLKTMHSQFDEELPRLDPRPPVCYADQNRCFKGDSRMNQQQGISMHHIVFERQHNRIAGRLALINPSWSNETVFQEARKILIARWQYVYCKEVIPTTLVDRIAKDARVHIDQLMEGTEFDPDAETVILAESVHSELRAHHIVPNSIGSRKLLWLDSGEYFTLEAFLSDSLNGQLNEPMRSSDFPMSTALAQELLKKTDEDLGLSMVMINIQRGRDTGLASFKDLVAWAFNTSINSFDDIANLDIFENYHVELLRTVYSNVEDIDMWVGGQMSKNYGAGVAFVHQKIRVIQHYGHIYGDRFFFSHKGVFTQEQREAIANSSSYSQMLCEVMDLDMVPVNTLEYGNNVTKKSCADFDQLDLGLWKA